MTRYSPSKNYLWAGAAALVLALSSVWFVLHWAPAAIPCGLFLASALILFILGGRPAIEIHPDFLAVGSQRINWPTIRRVDRTGWISPLVLKLTIDNGQQVWLVYPGDLDSSNSLLRHIRRMSREALLDGITYRQFWGDEPEVEKKPLASPKYQLLRSEDEDEVERLYQRLKAVGHLDPKDEK